MDAKILSSVSMFALTDRGFTSPDSDILSFSWQNRTFYLICRRYKKLKKVDRLSFSFLFFIVFLSLSQLQYSYFSTCSKPSQEWILKLKQSYKEDSQSNVWYASLDKSNFDNWNLTSRYICWIFNANIPFFTIIWFWIWIENSLANLWHIMSKTRKEPGRSKLGSIYLRKCK